MDLDERRIKLREALKEHKIQYKQVAELVGVTPQYVSLLLRGGATLKNERLRRLEVVGYDLVKKAKKMAQRAQNLANKPILEKTWVLQELRWKDCRRIVISEKSFSTKGKAKRAAKELKGGYEIFLRERLVKR